MNNILEGLTRELALSCIARYQDGSGAVFVYDGKIYSRPKDIGLTDGAFCPWADTWSHLINKHYDAQEAGKWAKPEAWDSVDVDVSGGKTQEYFYGKWPYDAEVARTNARREIEAFIAANGGPGIYEVRYEMVGRGLVSFKCQTDTKWPGLITCTTKELADEIIRRFPAQLRLLAGVQS